MSNSLFLFEHTDLTAVQKIPVKSEIYDLNFPHNSTIYYFLSFYYYKKYLW